MSYRRTGSPLRVSTTASPLSPWMAYTCAACTMPVVCAGRWLLPLTRRPTVANYPAIKDTGRTATTYPRTTPVPARARQQTDTGNLFRVGIFHDFVRLATRARVEGPHVGPQHVRGAKRNEIESKLTRPPHTDDFTAPWQAGWVNPRVASRSISPGWGLIRFRSAPRTYAPWGCIVRVVPDRLTKSRKTPT